ncbi:MAG: hypothetical protein DRG78_00405 [Epsilonproteobacteria bacterium]|nr:MAG: hypothetical protein DRG78_00405 [Campylobacterota bacterium]
MSYMQTDTLFPCHKTITSKTDESVKLTNEKVKNGTYKLCRGYVESMIKSCNCPKDPELKKILLEVRSDLSDDSMSIFQFKTHHKL